MSNSQVPPGQNKQQEEQRAKLKEAYLKLFLTSEARERLSNLRMVKPDIASMVEDQIIQLGGTGRLKKPLDDQELKAILAKLSPEPKEFKIKFA